MDKISVILPSLTLALETPSPSVERRAFVVVSAVERRKLNTADPSNMKYWLRKYEIPIEYLENDWDVSDD